LIFISLIYKVYPVYKANTTILRTCGSHMSAATPGDHDGTVFIDTFLQ